MHSHPAEVKASAHGSQRPTEGRDVFRAGPARSDGGSSTAAALGAAAAIALGACGGSTSPTVACLGTSNRNGRRISTTTCESSTAKRPMGGPTRLLNEWANCGRKWAEVTVSARLHAAFGPAPSDIVFDPGGRARERHRSPAGEREWLNLQCEWAACMRTNGDPNQTDPTIDQYGRDQHHHATRGPQTLPAEAHGTSSQCSQYELASENDLRAANPVPPPPTQAQLVQYVDCMPDR